MKANNQFVVGILFIYFFLDSGIMYVTVYYELLINVNLQITPYNHDYGTVCIFFFCSDEGNVRRMDTAMKINKLVRDKSEDSRLLMINLPKPPRSTDKELICILFKKLHFSII